MTFLLCAVFNAKAAVGCPAFQGLDFRDILQANLVIDGYVADYIKIDRRGENQDGLTYYAKITVKPRMILLGSIPEPSETIDLIWVNSTFGLRDTWEGERQVIIAAVDPAQPLEAKGHTVEWGLLTANVGTPFVLQGTCAGPFMFRMDHPAFSAAHVVFDGEGDAEVEAGILAEYLGLKGGF